MSSLRLPPPTGAARMSRMIRQDYLQRLIEQAAQALAQLLGLQTAGQQTQASTISGELAAGWLELSSEQLHALPDDELIGHLQRQGSIAEFPLRLGLAISLLKADGDRFSAGCDQAGAVRARSTALCLALRAQILNVAPELPNFTPGIADLRAELPFEDLPLPAAVLLMCYHEHRGQFGQAEDVLFALRRREGDDSRLQELGDQFYERLLRHTDAELKVGNLPREEVVEGARQWGLGNE